ncbi:hypothetical protein EPUS_00692 [Endocarpon pusillum Z07020]|uniref:Mid2 domain-containing protein n=1 Tax=Endocarpon pusillum (strain Z07020 / HMAS-L-300199) TaxID=1263415 RepID=U1GAM1_ENDPU|nr:uncharacterized protein EPUS_00692 [Endocarpon pusillum Z07020]ERF74562.1 hypothetical protein EPUS_00692 [Endocarpon pusillum Z07020]
MSTARNSALRVLFFFTVINLLSTTAAQTASSTYGVFSASSSPQSSNNDPNGFPSSSPNDNPDTENPETAGASGSSQTAISLSTGDQIAIGVVVGLVALIGMGSAILFYIAKKRQWEVRASLRRSARRVTTAFKARTPVKANFSRRDRGGAVRIDPPSPSHAQTSNKSKRSGGILKEAKRPAPEGRSDNTRNMDRDVEKGFGTKTKIEAVPRLTSPSPQSSRPTGQAPKSSFEMDSPLKGNRPDAGVAGKKGYKGWMKMLGRK